MSSVSWVGQKDLEGKRLRQHPAEEWVFLNL